MNYFNLYQELLGTDQFTDNYHFFDSKDYLSQLFSTPLNFEINSFENKLKLFCPYFLPLIEVANSPKCLEFYSGIGIFLEIAKLKNRESEVFYMNNHNGNSEKLAKRIYPDINIVNGTENIKYDFIFTDGTFNHFSDEEIIQKIDLIDGIINKGGVLCLLVNLDPLTLRKDFDIVKVHQLLQNKNFISIWGKNTFCSLWSKK
jgi:hypothetical protein